MNGTRLKDKVRAEVGGEGGKKGPGRPPKAAPPPEPQKAPIRWEAPAPYMVRMVAPLYKAHELEAPSVVEMGMVCASWGAVLEKYLPGLAGFEEEAAAVMVTLAVFGPLLIALLVLKKKEKPVPSPPPPGFPGLRGPGDVPKIREEPAPPAEDRPLGG